MRLYNYTIGMLAGLADLAGALSLRGRILRLSAYDGTTRNGFDLTADLGIRWRYLKRMARRLMKGT